MLVFKSRSACATSNNNHNINVCDLNGNERLTGGQHGHRLVHFLLNRSIQHGLVVFKYMCIGLSPIQNGGYKYTKNKDHI